MTAHPALAVETRAHDVEVEEVVVPVAVIVECARNEVMRVVAEEE